MVGGGEGRGMMKGGAKGRRYVRSNPMPDGRKIGYSGGRAVIPFLRKSKLGPERTFTLTECTRKEVCGREERGS